MNAYCFARCGKATFLIFCILQIMNRALALFAGFVRRACGYAEIFETALLQRERKTDYPFIIFDKQTNRCAGSSRFYDIQLLNATTQLGYTWYGKDFQRTGLNRHCKLLLLDYAFDEWEWKEWSSGPMRAMKGQ